jgi:thiamine biosynthesis lipoprotein
VLFSEVDSFEAIFRRCNPGREISQINRLRPGESLRIGVETYECLQAAYWVLSQTKGAFDINVGSLIKYKKSPGKKIKRTGLEILEQINLTKAQDGFVVTILPKKKAADAWILDLDLGGIGKGYALDKTVEILRDWSIQDALVHGGTSTVLAIGLPPDRNGKRQGWPVGIAGDWKCPQAPREFLLRDRAISGSGTEVKRDHIFDPRTGRPAKGHLAAWVSHASASVSDALSTAFMVMSTSEVRAFCRKHPDVWALVVVDDDTCKIYNEKAAS